MAHVVFLRGANVGGNNVFRPTILAAALKHLDIVNIGAAGTFVVRGKATAADIRRQVLAQLSFEPAIMIRPAKDITALVARDPFRGVEFSKDLRGWVGTLGGAPRRTLSLPIVEPDGENWAVRFDRLDGPFALGLWRRTTAFRVPANNVEAVVGVPVTVRWWETMVRIATTLG